MSLDYVFIAHLLFEMEIAYFDQGQKTESCKTFMEKNTKLEAVSRFLDQISNKEKPNVLCPECKTKLMLVGDPQKSYMVKCGTKGCLESKFRGI